MRRVGRWRAIWSGSSGAVPVSFVSVPIEMPEGPGAVVAFADLEERVRAEQVVRERDAVLGARQDSLLRIAALVLRTGAARPRRRLRRCPRCSIGARYAS
jgi:hypothetical protein